MAVRSVVATFLLVFSLLGSPAHATTPGEYATQVLRYDQVMKLTRDQQIQYINGLRSILAELEQMQHSSKQSLLEKKRMSARIEFLKLFIQEAEATAASSSQTCPASLTNHRSLQAHEQAGAVLRCFPGAQACPSPMISLGAFGDTKICFDMRHENFAKWQANRAKLGLPKVVIARAKSNSSTKTHRSISPKATASTASTAVPSTTEEIASQPPAAAPSESTPDAETAPTESHIFDQQDRAGDDALAKIADRANAKLIDGTLATNQISRTADQMTDGEKGDEIIAREVDTDGDMHETRRQIANFHMLDQARQLRDDGGTQDDACVTSLPRDPNPPPTCTKATIKTALDQLQKKDSHHCLAAGMLSHYNDNQVRSHNCQPPREFCMNRVTCRKSDGAMAPYSQVLFSCHQPGEIICNPYIFNLDKDNKPICVPNRSDATKECNKRASDDKPFFLWAAGYHGIVEGWNEFADRFNEMCFQAPEKDYYCAECAMIKFRLAKLNRNVMHVDDNNAMCNMMVKLRAPGGGANGARAKSNN